MSIGADLQQLNSGQSPYIELFEIQVNDTDYIYITNYIEGFGSSPEAQFNTLQFRDYDSPSTVREYFPVPAQFDGIEHKSEGQFPQPTFTIANVLRTPSGDDSLQALLGSASYEDILGGKVIRRRTLKKYLFGESGDSNPPIELPRDVYYLDRIENEDSESVTFTTVLPIDFTGVLLPRRNIIGNRCPWKYQAAGSDVIISERQGGCLWRQDSSRTVAGSTINIYVNEDDEYIISSSILGSAPSYSGSATQDEFYTTTTSGLTKINSDGTLTGGQSQSNYWQSLTGTNTTPSDSDTVNWRRVRRFDNFSGTETMNVFTDDRYNSYYKYGDTVWKAISRSQTSSTPPALGTYWDRGDKCGKRLNSCKVRFQVNPVGTITVSNTTNLAGQDVITGQANGVTAVVTRISGNTLYLAQITGDFNNGETLQNDDGDFSATVTSSGINALAYSTNSLQENNVMPFGSFPTARVFQ